MMYLKKFGAIKKFKMIRINCIGLREQRTNEIQHAVVKVLLINGTKIRAILIE